jgi:hypothetical protein
MLVCACVWSPTIGYIFCKLLLYRVLLPSTWCCDHLVEKTCHLSMIVHRQASTCTMGKLSKHAKRAHEYHCWSSCLCLDRFALCTAHLRVFQKRAGNRTPKNLLQPTRCNQNFLLSVSITTMLVVFHHLVKFNYIRIAPRIVHDIFELNTTSKQSGRIPEFLSCLHGSEMCFEQRLCCNVSSMRHLCAIYAHIATVYAHKHRIFVYAPPSAYYRIKSWPNVRFMRLILRICA